MHAVQRQIRIGGEQERADIQARTGIGGNPVLIELDNGADALERLIGVDAGQADTVAGLVQAGHVVPRTEQLHAEYAHLAVGTAVGLQTLKDLGAVVEDARGGGEGNGAVGDDAGIMPALGVRVVHNEHVVGEVVAEAQLVGRGQGALVRILRNFDFHRMYLLLKYSMIKARLRASYSRGWRRSIHGTSAFPRR